MRKKSYLSLLTGLLFSALVLSACSGSGNANNPGTAGYLYPNSTDNSLTPS